MSEWDAAAVRDRLRARHPATQRMGVRTIPGPWTCIDEWDGVDLLAFCVHSSPPTGCEAKVRYPRVGYEVKVSRADYRTELRKPYKRTAARAMCHEFYFAVPTGLLRPDEIEADGPTQLELDDAGPGLWVPDDVGLVEVDGRGCRVRRPSPLIAEPEPPFYCGNGERNLHDFIRWISARPDPRHAGVVERARQTARDIRARTRGHAPDPSPSTEAA